MPYLRTLLGVLLVIIALVSASLSSASQNFHFNADNTSQSDDSDDQQSDQVVSVDDFLFQKRFALLTPAQLEKSSEVAGVRSEKPASATFSRVVTCLIPARLFISQCGLLPRAPKIA